MPGIRNARERTEGASVGTVPASPIVTALGEWLSAYPWEAWCTLTFRAGEFSHEAATRAVNRWLEWIRKEGSPDVAYFVAHELGNVGGRLHLHGLLGNLTAYTSRKALWDRWFKQYGRAQVLPYDPERGAAYYVSKYVTKELAHWDFDLNGYLQPLELFPRKGEPKCSATAKPTRPRKPSGSRTTFTPSGKA